jgi:TRAP-type C4-dicarboxylate transport system permease large subunit
MMPFFLAMLVVLVLLTYIPALSMWLPSMFM